MVKVTVVQKDVTEATATARTHNVTIDRSEAKGGTDRGAMGGEVFLMGLGGCFMSNLLAAIRAREIDATDIAVEINATVEEKPARFSAIDMKVTGKYPDRKEMEKLLIISERACIVANTLKNAVELKISLV